MSDIIQKAEQFVFDTFKGKLKPEYTYHNFFHTQFVVSKAEELIKGEKISDEDAELIILAAWFHDAGYIETVDGHEKAGAEIAEKFLRENNYPADKTETVKELIVSTNLSHIPANKLEMVIKDADTSNLGDSIFDKLTIQLQREIALRENRLITNEEWDERNCDFLTKGHKYYTDYAKEKWQPVKLENLIRIQRRINKREKEAAEEATGSKVINMDKPGRGVETMFRVTLNNHTRLSDIADSKANILLSVNAIIISIALSTLVPKLASTKNQYLIFPTLVMLLVSVISIIFAIMATRPNITSKSSITPEDIKNRKVNLLFFGNFHRMPLDQYQDAMDEMMTDNNYLYRSLTRDLYYLGVVLNRKYRLLRITYTVFLVGTILTVLAFVIAFMDNANVEDFFD